MYRAKAGKLIFMLPITMFYRKEALAAGGYRLDGFPKGEIRYQDLSEDLDLWSRMSDFYTDGKIMITIPETHYYYRKHKDSLSSRKDRQLAMNFKMAYIKHNLKLRRMSKPEVTYVQFIAGLSDDKRKEIERDFWAGYHYRAAAYSILEHRYFHALKHMIQTVFISPKFAAQKLKASL